MVAGSRASGNQLSATPPKESERLGRHERRAEGVQGCSRTPGRRPEFIKQEREGEILREGEREREKEIEGEGE